MHNSSRGGVYVAFYKVNVQFKPHNPIDWLNKDMSAQVVTCPAKAPLYPFLNLPIQSDRENVLLGRSHRNPRPEKKENDVKFAV